MSKAPRVLGVVGNPRQNGNIHLLVSEVTRLPAWKDRQEKPAELVVVIPHRLSASGAVRISFLNNSAANAVVSEVWLLEESRPE